MATAANARRVAGAALLVGPTVLAFFAGGYFDGPRAWAGLIAWALVALGLLLRARSFPRARGGRVALAGLGLLATWTLLSASWAPVTGAAYHAGQLVFVYLGATLAATILLRERSLLRAVEPALAGGALVVVGYGLSERLFPGALHFAHSVSAQGRLEQPLTYWNAMGELAALGLVLCARLAGDPTRQRALRAVAIGAAAPLGMGLYISFSRGALFACAAGAVALLVAAPRRQQLWSLIIAVCAGGAGALVAAPLHAVTSLSGAAATREREGAIAFGLLALVMVVAMQLQLRLADRQTTGALRLPRRSPLIATGLICAGLALAIVVGGKEGNGVSSSGANRYASLQSNRYAYWRVALRAFGDQPLRGVGAGGWAVYWLRYRPFDDFAVDAHSLPLQTAAELGLVGLALLLAFLGGVAAAARSAHRTSGELAAGPLAGCVVWVAHAPLDWDWQLPAVTLVALVLAGALLVLAEPDAPATAPA